MFLLAIVDYKKMGKKYLEVQPSDKQFTTNHKIYKEILFSAFLKRNKSALDPISHLQGIRKTES